LRNTGNSAPLPGIVPQQSGGRQKDLTMISSAATLRRLFLPALVAFFLVCSPSVQAQPARGTGPGAAPGTGAAGGFEPIPTFAPGGGEDETPWGTIIGVVVGVLLLGGIIAAVAVSQQQKKNSSAVPSDKDSIGGYRLRNMLWQGQSSQLWEVVETVSSRHFAMKVLLPEKARDAEHRHMLFHEASVGQQLAHPNIIKIVKVIQDSKNPGIVMEYFPAGSVKVRIIRKQWDFIYEHANSIFKQAATALAFMNAKGWVHRDVKPDNILVNSAGDVRLIDFALAKRVQKGGKFRLFKRSKVTTQGTRSYMSPEQIRGEPLDGRADVYSFGCAAYEIVTGRPPFRGQTNQDLLNKHLIEKPVSPEIHNKDVTKAFADLVLKCLAKKKEERPPEFHTVLMQLRTMSVFKPEALKKLRKKEEKPDVSAEPPPAQAEEPPPPDEQPPRSDEETPPGEQPAA
jgi:serine/threonine protein kinase